MEEMKSESMGDYTGSSLSDDDESLSGFDRLDQIFAEGIDGQVGSNRRDIHNFFFGRFL